MSDAAAGSKPNPNPFAHVFGPFGQSILKFLWAIGWLLAWIFLIVLIVGGAAYLYANTQSGQAQSTVTHVASATEETVGNPVSLYIKRNSPTLYYTFVEPGKIQPFAIDSTVQANRDNKDLGLNIVSFEPISPFFRPNEEIRVIGKIKARGLDQPTEIEVACQLNDGTTIPAELFGSSATGLNKGTILKGQTVEFTANCNFPQGVSTDKVISTAKTKLIVTYDFETQAYQRIWALDKTVLADLQNQGIDPFEHFGKQDPDLDSNNKIKAVTTPGPLNLGLQIDFPQPIASDSKYELFAQLRPQEYGSLKELKSLTIQVPAVQELTFALQGEALLGSNSKCDFTYSGETENGYKEYQLTDAKIQQTNTECNKKVLTELADAGLPTREACLEYFREQRFACNFAATKAPQTLLSDIIKAKAVYTFEVEKERVIDIKGAPTAVA